MVTTIEDLHPDLLTSTLSHLDGPSLAATSCVTSHLHSLSNTPNLWRDLCLSTWPSLHLLPLSSYQSFFSNAHPFPSPLPSHVSTVTTIPANLISAIDVYHKHIPIISRIVCTDISTPWSQTSPFRIDVVLSPTATAISPEDVSLSWIIIDPETQHCVNVSSRSGTAMERHWYTGYTVVRFPIVVGSGGDGECAVTAVVACGEDGVREVSLTVEDMDGTCLNGRESVMIVKRLMEGGRTVKEGAVEAGRKYKEHVTRRRQRKERKMLQEGLLDLCCSTIGVALFLVFMVVVCW